MKCPNARSNLLQQRPMALLLFVASGFFIASDFMQALDEVFQWRCATG